MGTPLIPGYEVIRELGRGGMGIVYEAKHLALNRLVAIKMISKPTHVHSDDVSRFLSEAEAVAQLQHPNIVQIHEVGEHEGLPFMALELVTGGTLLDRFQGEPLSVKEAAALVEELARAMNLAHLSGIVHRDLKPQNVLLTENGLPKITDFGLAKRIGEDGASLPSQITQTGAIVGTPAYMAPEQANGQSKRVGPSADIYALGGILYQALTKRLPFEAESPLDTLLKVVHEEPVAPRQIHAEIPRDLETICLKCLHKEPQQRYASAAELADDLHRWQEGRPIVARPTGLVERIGLWVKRRPTVAALLGLVMATALAGLALAGWQWREAVNARIVAEQKSAQAEQAHRLERARAEAEERARREAQQQREEAQRQLARAEAAGHASQMALVQVALRDRDYRQGIALLDQTPTEHREAEWHILRQQCEFALQADAPMLSHEGAVACLAFDPRSRLIATGEESIVRLWDAKTHTILASLLEHSGRVTDLAFSPDGKFLASASADKTVKILDVEEARIAHTLSGHRDAVTSLAFHPNEGQVITSSSDRTIRIWDLATGKTLRTLTGHKNPITDVAISADGKWIASSARDGPFWLWDYSTGNQVMLPINRSENRKQGVSVEFHPSEPMLACGLVDGGVDLWSISKLRLIRTLDRATGSVSSLTFSPDETYLAGACSDGSICLWDRSRSAVLHRFRDSGVSSSPFVQFHPTGERLASSFHSKKVKLWDVGLTPGRIRIPEVHPTERASAFSLDGTLLAFNTNRGTVAIWDLKEHRVLHELELFGEPLGFLAFTVRDTLLGNAGDALVHHWNSRRGTYLASLPLLEATSALSFDVDGDWLVAGDERGGISAWELHITGRIYRFPAHASPVTALAVHPKRTLLASTRSSRTIRLSDFHTGTLARTLSGHEGTVSTLAWSPQGAWLASGSLDGTVKLWNPNTGESTQPSREGGSPVLDVRFSPSGKRLAVTRRGQPIEFWAVPSMVKVRTLSAETRSFRASTTFDAMGRLLVSPWSSELAVWHIAPREQSTKDQERFAKVRWHQQQFDLATERRDYRAALFHIRHLRRLSPDQPSYLLGEARTYAHRDEPKATLRALSHYIQSWPTTPPAFRSPRNLDWIGALFAKPHFREALESIPETSWSIRVVKALIYHSLEHQSLADQLLDRISKDEESLPTWIRALQASWALGTGRVTRAEQLAKSLQSHDPIASFEWHLERAITYENRQAYRIVAWHLERAVKSQPILVDLWRRSAIAHAELGAWQKSAGAFERMLLRVPKDRESRRQLALVHLAQGQNDAHRQRCEEVLQRLPKSQSLRRWKEYRRILRTAALSADGVEHWDTVLGMYRETTPSGVAPDAPYALLARAGEWEELRRRLLRAEGQFDEDQVVVQLYLARVYAETGAIEKSRASTEAALLEYLDQEECLGSASVLMGISPYPSLGMLAPMAALTRPPGRNSQPSRDWERRLQIRLLLEELHRISTE